jgi:C4-dicarboxylate-specific signal transduction histidine kinase
VLISPTDRQLLEASLQLSRALSADAARAQLLECFVETLSALLPGRLLCVRAVDPRTLATVETAVSGEHQPLGRHLLGGAPLVFKRSGVRTSGLATRVAESPRVRLVDRYEPLLGPGLGGFAVPLVAAGELFGLLNVEYTCHAELADREEQLVLPLANQLSLALRSQHLLGESRSYQESLARVIDSAPVLVVATDREGRVTICNRALERYVGFDGASAGRSAVELFGSSLGALLIEAQERSVGEDERAQAVEAGSVCEREVVLRRREEGVGRALFNCTVLRGAHGEVEGVLAVGQDVERLRSLERQVIQAEKLATLGQLAAGIVHELNNPLTSISVYGELVVRLLERASHRPLIVSEAEIDKARRITEGAARIHSLTRGLMGYARPAGERSEVRLDEVVRQSLSLCDHVLVRQGAEVELSFAPELPTVQAVASQLQQVLINLLTNACEAATTRPLRLTLSTAVIEDERARWALLEVKDNGPGIDLADQPHIFEPFFTAKKEGRGTGLGLSIVKTIVEAHGGRLALESRPGEGATFRVLLPLATTDSHGA